MFPGNSQYRGEHHPFKTQWPGVGGIYQDHVREFGPNPTSPEEQHKRSSLALDTLLDISPLEAPSEIIHHLYDNYSGHDKGNLNPLLQQQVNNLYTQYRVAHALGRFQGANGVGGPWSRKASLLRHLIHSSGKAGFRSGTHPHEEQAHIAANLLHNLVDYPEAPEEQRQTHLHQLRSLGLPVR